MASEIIATQQSTGETRTHFVDFTPDLPASVSVTAGTAALSGYPTGGTASLSTGVIASGVVPVVVTTPTAAGVYYVTVTATLSNGDTSAARLVIPVVWASTRSGMYDLIGKLRAMTDAGMSDYTIGGAAYWSDKHLQDALDRHQILYDYQMMTSLMQRSGAAYVYKIFETYVPDWELSPVIMDAAGGTVSASDYAFNGATGRVTFTANQAGSLRMISGTAYNVNAAAADVWTMKAAHYAGAYDVSTDGQSLKRSQLVAQARQMASYYSSLSMATGGNSVELYRGDM